MGIERARGLYIVRAFRTHSFAGIRRGGRVAEGARLERVYTGNRIEGSNPSLSATGLWSILVTWFTVYTGHMVYTLSGENGFGPGSTRSSFLSKKPKS